MRLKPAAQRGSVESKLSELETSAQTPSRARAPLTADERRRRRRDWRLAGVVALLLGLLAVLE